MTGADVKPSTRDLRLDLFRGMALWFIFIDHIPGNKIAELTYRNFGFSDATEVFVFISGYTAALVYGSRMDREGLGTATTQVLRRVWQLYVAHILLFLVYVVQVSWASARYRNPVFVKSLNVQRLLDDPAQTLLQALTLHYRPVNLDVLPLYIALLTLVPLVIWLSKRSALLTLLASGLVYAGVQQFKWAFPVYADGTTWYFNPLGWQFLFVLGAVLARVPTVWAGFRWHRWLISLAVSYLIFALLIAIGWQHEDLGLRLPRWLAEWMYPIDKTNLDILRIAHFLAIAYLVTRWITPDHPALAWRVWTPLIRCGQHSLYIFCLGVSLSFVAYFVLVQFGRSYFMQTAVVVLGLLILVLVAQTMHAFRADGKKART